MKFVTEHINIWKNHYLAKFANKEKEKILFILNLDSTSLTFQAISIPEINSVKNHHE